MLVGRAGMIGGEERRYLRKVPLEAGGGDDLQRPRRRVARVPEGVRHFPWFEDQVAGTGDEDLVSDLDPDLAFEDVGVLVLACVCSGAARMRGPIGWSTSAKVPPLAAPSIMNRTPSPPIITFSPSSGDNTIRARGLPIPSMVVLLLWFLKPRLVCLLRPEWLAFSRGPQ